MLVNERRNRLGDRDGSDEQTKRGRDVDVRREKARGSES